MSADQGISGYSGRGNNTLGWSLVTGVVCLTVGAVGGTFWGGRTLSLENLAVDINPPSLQDKQNKLGFPDAIAGFRGEDGKQVGKGVRLRGVAPDLYSSEDAYEGIKNHTQQRLTLRGPKPPKSEKEETEKEETTVQIDRGDTLKFDGPATLYHDTPSVKSTTPYQEMPQEQYQEPLQPLQEAPSYQQPSNQEGIRAPGLFPKVPTEFPGNSLPPVPTPPHQSTSGPNLKTESYDTNTAQDRQASYTNKDSVSFASKTEVVESQTPVGLVPVSRLDVGGWRTSSD